MVTSTALGATLATCTDPRLLVPGSAGALRGDADDLQQRSRALAQQATDLRVAHPAAWTGTASERWAGRREQLAQTLETVSQIHDTAASTLLLHADALQWGQTRADTAIRLYAKGCDLRDAQLGLASALLTGHDSADADAGAGYRSLAEDVLASAQEQVTTSARAAAAVLDQLAGGLPDGRWHVGDFAAGMWSWASDAASLLWKFSSLRVLVDTRGALGDGRAMLGEGVETYESLVDDPLSTAARLGQLDLLHDRPAQWWGQIAPDIALAAAGGAGAATRAMRGIGAVDDLARAGGELTTTSSRLYQAGSRWADPAERARWIDELYDAPTEESGAHRRAVTSTAPWAQYQVQATGSAFEYRLTGGSGKIWADHVRLDADGIAAMDAKLVTTPGRSIYEGNAPPFVVDRAMAKFDDEIERYVAVINEPGNPVARLRIPTSTQDAVAFLQARAESIAGPGIDVQVYFHPIDS
jgi:uncharacterized protein YukE